MNSATNRPPNDERTIAGYFRNPNDAEKAISQLSSAGFSKKDIGVALRDHSAQLRTETPAATGWAQRFRSMFQPNEREEYANKDAMDVLDHMGVPDREAQYFKQAILHGGVAAHGEYRGPEQRSLEHHAELQRSYIRQF